MLVQDKNCSQKNYLKKFTNKNKNKIETLFFNQDMKKQSRKQIITEYLDNGIFVVPSKHPYNKEGQVWKTSEKRNYFIAFSIFFTRLSFVGMTKGPKSSAKTSFVML